MDSSFSAGLGGAIGCFFYGLIIATIGCIIMGAIFIKQWIWPKPVKIESTTLIVPEIKLTIKDNKVDTLYIYKP